MSAWKLYKYTEHLAGNRQKTERYEIAMWKKLFYPLATLVMMALALPFAYIQARAGMVGVKVFSGIMLGTFFHMLNSLFSHVGLLQNWPPVAAAAVPSAAFFLAAVLMMWWVERRWISAATGDEPRSGEPVVQELALAVEQGPQDSDPARHQQRGEHEAQQRLARRHARAPRRHQADVPGFHGERLSAAQPAPEEVAAKTAPR